MKEKIVVISFMSVLFLFMLLEMFMPDKTISFSERRKLTERPKIQQDVGAFFNKVGDYLVDQFPFRENFRKGKGWTLMHVYQKKENQGTFILKDNLFQSNNEINEKSVSHLTSKIKEVSNTYFQNQSIYFAMIPDKNYYIQDDSIPKINYKELETSLKKQLPNNINWIDLKETLNLNSYYQTDIHWKQESLEETIKKIREHMNLEMYPFPNNQKTYNPFYGALFSRLPSNIKPDTLTYVTDLNIENAQVYNYEKQKMQKVYEERFLKNIDSYDVFLAGATPLLTIQNPLQANGKELILFRDSFGSSLAPLLIANYSKITMIDLRYINSTLLKDIPELNLQNSPADILFLYSVPIINNSFALK